AAAIVFVLVRDGDECFAEKRVALAPHLDPFARGFGFLAVAQNTNTPPAGRGIDADGLQLTAEVGKRDVEDNRMDIEAALRVLAGAAELEEIKDRLDVAVKTIVALAGKGTVALAQCRNGLCGVRVKF